jgi:hypothetical protein
MSCWYGAGAARKKRHQTTGFNLKDSNNIYHIDLGINQSEHRYSMEAVELLWKVINNDVYTVITDDVGTELTVTPN